MNDDAKIGHVETVSAFYAAVRHWWSGMLVVPVRLASGF